MSGTPKKARKYLSPPRSNDVKKRKISLHSPKWFNSIDEMDNGFNLHKTKIEEGEEGKLRRESQVVANLIFSKIPSNRDYTYNFNLKFNDKKLKECFSKHISKTSKQLFLVFAILGKVSCLFFYPIVTVEMLKDFSVSKVVGAVLSYVCGGSLAMYLLTFFFCYIFKMNKMFSNALLTFGIYYFIFIVDVSSLFSNYNEGFVGLNFRHIFHVILFTFCFEFSSFNKKIMFLLYSSLVYILCYCLINCSVLNIHSVVVEVVFNVVFVFVLSSILNYFWSVLIRKYYVSYFKNRDKCMAIRKVKKSQMELIKNVLSPRFFRVFKGKSSHCQDYFDTTNDNGYIFHLDIVNFTQFCNDFVTNEIVHHLNNLYYYYDKEAEKLGIERLFMLGDAWIGFSEDIFKIRELLVFSHLVINHSLNNQFKVRIGISYGNFTFVLFDGLEKLDLTCFGESYSRAQFLQEKCEENSVLVDAFCYKQISNQKIFTDEEDIKRKSLVLRYCGKDIEIEGYVVKRNELRKVFIDEEMRSRNAEKLQNREIGMEVVSDYSSSECINITNTIENEVFEIKIKKKSGRIMNNARFLGKFISVKVLPFSKKYRHHYIKSIFSNFIVSIMASSFLFVALQLGSIGFFWEEILSMEFYLRNPVCVFLCAFSGVFTIFVVVLGLFYVFIPSRIIKVILAHVGMMIFMINQQIFLISICFIRGKDGFSIVFKNLYLYFVCSLIFILFIPYPFLLKLVYSGVILTEMFSLEFLWKHSHQLKYNKVTQYLAFIVGTVVFISLNVLSQVISLKMYLRKKNLKIKEEKFEGVCEQKQKFINSIVPCNIGTYVISKTVENKRFDLFSEFSRKCEGAVGFFGIEGLIHPLLPFLDTLKFLNEVFKKFDFECKHRGVTKVKIVQCDYLCVNGNLSPVGADIAIYVFKMCDLFSTFSRIFHNEREKFFEENVGKDKSDQMGSVLRFKAGIACGNYMSCILGKKRVMFDVFSGSVNLSCRLMQTCIPDKVSVSRETIQTLRSHPNETKKNSYSFCRRKDSIKLKGFGEMEGFILNTTKKEFIRDTKLGN